MQTKTYGQMCPIARSLDILGERWTLLLVRELLLGPKKFKDFLRVMPSMGTNRLSQRLKLLVDAGVVVRKAPRGAAYVLTERGEQLRGPLLALGLWGLGLPAGDRMDELSVRAELIALSMTTLNKSEKSEDLSFTYEFHVDAEVFHICVKDGAMNTYSGPSDAPADALVICDLESFVKMVAGQSAANPESIRLESGTEAQLMKLFDLLEKPPHGSVEALLPNLTKIKVPDQ